MTSSYGGIHFAQSPYTSAYPVYNAQSPAAQFVMPMGPVIMNSGGSFYPMSPEHSLVYAPPMMGMTHPSARPTPDSYSADASAANTDPNTDPNDGEPVTHPGDPATVPLMAGGMVHPSLGLMMAGYPHPSAYPTHPTTQLTHPSHAVHPHHPAPVAQPEPEVKRRRTLPADTPRVAPATTTTTTTPAATAPTKKKRAKPEEEVSEVDAKEAQRQKRLVRNRLSAQLSRERRRIYIETLESKLDKLNKDYDNVCKETAKLRKENAQLRAAITNPASVPPEVLSLLLMSSSAITTSVVPRVVEPLEKQKAAEALRAQVVSEALDSDEEDSDDEEGEETDVSERSALALQALANQVKA
eukprot:TRINITY_DN864_c0_g5_i2.p1 TRINITY_DN864_c0_g5~~TRINITY_DN864_c0_g5_i2.p1  ORF type:complete len:355 (-),score=98.22 TRINITY_DN864_c0_g5_i2:102-1166(-)